MGYAVKLRPNAEAHRIRAIMSIAVDGNCAAEIRRVLSGHPNVITLRSANGRWDLIAELRADTLEAFDKALNAIRRTDGIATTETSILLSSYKF